MARPTAAAPLVALLLLVAAGRSGAGGSADDDAGSAWSFDTMIGCAPEASSKADAASFRAGLAPLLAALPSAAAATGFAALPSASAGAAVARARALGLCFGPSVAPGDESGCEECLQDAVAAVGLCAGDVRSAGAWRPGCAVVYADDGASPADEGGGDSRPRFPSGGDTRSYADTLDQTLAELVKALAQPKPQPLWKIALSVLFYVLAAIGAAAVVFLLCVFVAGWYLAETLTRNVVAAGLQHGNAGAGAGEGEGIAVYVAATNGPAPIWSIAMHLRFH